MSSSTAIGACHDATFVISLPSRQSLFANRYSLPFSARQEFRHPIHPVPRPILFLSPVPRPTTLAPFCFRPPSHDTRPVQEG